MTKFPVLAIIAEAAPPADDIYDIVVIAPKESFLPLLIGSLLAILLVIGIALGLYFLFRRPSQLPQKSAEIRAFDRLKATQERRETLSANEYTLALSETLKDYLSEKFEDPVRFETTPEFLSRVAEEPSRFPISAQQHLQSFLIRAEEVKFGNASDSDKKAAPLGKIAEQVVQLCQVVNERGSENAR